jgi:hypothetical protein
VASRPRVTGPSVRTAARSAGSRPSIRPVTTARPPSTGRHCPAVIRRARPAAVAELSPGTGVICCPAASARWRSSPARKSSPGQLRGCDPRQQLPGAEAAIALLDRAGRRVQCPDHAQPPAQLADRGHPRIRGQSPIRRADPHLPALLPPATYPVHQIGASPLDDRHFAMIIIPGQSGTIGIYAAVSPTYSRNRVRDSQTPICPGNGDGATCARQTASRRPSALCSNP